MEVNIDGVEYVPKDETGVAVHGITYDNVSHWLYNVRTTLVNKWIRSLKEGQVPNTEPEQQELYDKIYEFDMFCEKYLGYKYQEGYGFVEFL